VPAHRRRHLLRLYELCQPDQPQTGLIALKCRGNRSLLIETVGLK
jgi:hypothetical protein